MKFSPSADLLCLAKFITCGVILHIPKEINDQPEPECCMGHTTTT